MTTPSEREAKNYGRDLWLPDDTDGALRVTVTGDIATVEGLENAERAIRRCVLVEPGAVLHRPNYGAGLTSFVSLPNSPNTRARAANAIRRAVLQDDRVQEASVSVSAANRAVTSATPEDVMVVSLAVTWAQDESTSITVRA